MIETRQIDNTQSKLISDLKAFGWIESSVTSNSYTEYHTRSAGVSHTRQILIMARETKMENYDKLNDLETQYNSLKSQIRTYVPMDGTNILIAFLCLINPGIIYVSVKLHKKHKIIENNKKLSFEMDKLVEQGMSILQAQ